MALAVPVMALPASSTSVRAQAVQPVTCLVHGTPGSEGINPAGASITNSQDLTGLGSNATLLLQSQGANGTSGATLGGAAGDVSITNSGTIYSPGILTPGVQGLGGLVIPQAAAIWAQSVGGCGYADDNASGHGGTSGNVSVTVNQGSVIQLGPNVAAVYALSAGGQGGGYSHDSNHNVNGGGAAGDVSVILSSSINVPALPPVGGLNTDNAYGIYALSVGGYSGATDNKDSALGGNAGSVSVVLNPGAQINMRGDNSIAVYAFSAGGLSWYAEDGVSNGHQNGNGGDVSVTVARNAAITTNGELGVGILAVSTGGNANTSQQPPDSLENGGSPNSVPSTLAPPGNAGNVTVDNRGTITTQGDVAIGILAASATGGRGVGLLKENSDGTYEIDQVGQVGPGAGTPGTVTVTNAGTISTSGVGAIGILGLSLGGSGGVMDSKPGLLNLLGSHTAGTGANGNSVYIIDAGTITTTGIAALGILAESVGGGGGTATGTSGVIAIGTNGGVGGNGSTVSVEKRGGSVTTQGDGAFGILAHSVGGGGGNGANATGLVASVGGAGGASADGDTDLEVDARAFDGARHGAG
ncbi:MAG: hypothetical protein H2042_07745, partial [Rhizobiales bacterium]|nr:hypothetical protein [Hyphomicrobiales bacterium]